MSEPSTTTIPSTLQQTKAIFAACLCAVVLQIFLTAPSQAAEELRSVVVADPYIEMRTGPGRGYPIFHVVDRGENISIVMQRTDWYLVRDADGDEGWVDRAQM
ncbi:MAG: SH3 domain-containing protein, partial [Gammaproteobacteria bacterium]|nr:SH3 domain-containing protein [Gammaproteobacteria bacterium]